MTSDPYSDTVRAYFSAPAHAGAVESGRIVRLDDQGICVEFSAAVEHDRITQLRFRAWGCPHLIASAEAICSRLEDGPVADLEQFSAAEIMQTLSVPVEKTGRILVLEDAVRSLGSKLRGASGRQTDE